jgi:hypothetical protein
MTPLPSGTRGGGFLLPARVIVADDAPAHDAAHRFPPRGAASCSGSHPPSEPFRFSAFHCADGLRALAGRVTRRRSTA